MTEAPTALVHTLVEIGLVGKTSRWVAMPGGRTNRVWRIETPGGAIVCKLFAAQADNPLYPNAPGVEYETLRALAPSGIVPDPLALVNTPLGDALIYRHIRGKVWTSGTAEVALLLARLHAMGLVAGLREIPSGSAALIRQTRAILARCDRICADIPRIMPDAGIAPARQPSLIHTDIVAGNLIVTDQGLCLIDWQCPAQGDPCEDIASFLSPAMQYLYADRALGIRDREAFLSVYPDHAIVDRYRRLATLFHWRIAAYCQWKITHGDDSYRRALGLEVSALQDTYADYDQTGQNNPDRNIAEGA